MLTKSWRLRPGLLLAVPTILVSLSGLAHAQQSGLFPLHPIKRERVPCPNEDPVYKLYRYQYFGYHPTVWRRFPEGWGVPSPEAPNPKAEFEKLPVKPVDAIPPEEGEDQDMQPPPERGGQAIPNPPPDTERSPFEMDRPNTGAGAAGTNPPARRAPGARNAPAPGAEPSPFDIPADDAAQPAPVPGKARRPSRRCRACPIQGLFPTETAPPPGNAPAPRHPDVKRATSPTRTVGQSWQCPMRFCRRWRKARAVTARLALRRPGKSRVAEPTRTTPAAGHAHGRREPDPSRRKIELAIRRTGAQLAEAVSQRGELPVPSLRAAIPRRCARSGLVCRSAGA